MTRSDAINRVLAALGAGGTVLAQGPDPKAKFARQLVDVCIALEIIKVEQEPIGFTTEPTAMGTDR